MGISAYKPDTPWQPFAALMTSGFILFLSLYLVPRAICWLNSSYFLSTGLQKDEIVRAIQGLTIIALVWFASGMWNGRTVAVLSLNRPVASGKSQVAYVSMALTAMLLLSFAIKEVFGRFGGPLPINPSGNIASPIADLITVTLISPISEEFLFRGFLLSALSKSIVGFWPSATLISFVWALLHLQQPWYAVLTVFIFGLILSFAIWRTGRLWTCIIAHGLYNLYPALFRLIASSTGLSY